MFASKLADVGTTIFSVMTQLAAEHQAINLGQGYPDFPPADALLADITAAMADGWNQYASMAGVPSLREHLADKNQTLYGHRYDPDTDITITSGATQAIMAAVFACVGAGDEVIVLEPSYDSYVPAIRLAGGIPVPVPMTEPDAMRPVFRPDWDRIRNAITDRTRAIMLNFPHNPTGAILDTTDLDALEAIVADTRIVLISDEVYEHIVFDGKAHLSLATRPSLAARSYVISSFGKTLHATGWKIGYCCAPEGLSAEFRKVHQFMVYSVSTPMQWGIAAYLAKHPDVYPALPGFYQAKRDRLAAGLAQTALKPLPSPGTFFMLADYSDISTLPQGEFAKWLTTSHGVAAIPVSAFYIDPRRVEQSPTPASRIVRLCFAKQESTLDLAIERLVQLGTP